MDFFFRVTLSITTDDLGTVVLDTERFDGATNREQAMIATIQDFIARRGVFAVVSRQDPTCLDCITAIEFMYCD